MTEKYTVAIIGCGRLGHGHQADLTNDRPADAPEQTGYEQTGE